MKPKAPPWDLPQLRVIGLLFGGLFLISFLASFLVGWFGRIALFLVALFLIGAPVAKFLNSARIARQKAEQARALQISEVDSMTGHEFERYVALLLRSKGFNARATKGSGDSGVDVIAENGRVSYAIQCKLSVNAISRRAISDAVGGVAHYKCTNSMVVTNSHFTSGAKSLADSNKCILVDRAMLAVWIHEWQNGIDHVIRADV